MTDEDDFAEEDDPLDKDDPVGVKRL